MQLLHGMRLRYINMTTNLPIDDTLERHLHRVMGGATADHLFDPDSFRRRRYRMRGIEMHADVLFVSAQGLDQERRRVMELSRVDEDQVDALGLYFSCHSEFGRPVIMVSPEKVMQTGVDLRRRHSLALPLQEVFPLALSGIVVHELAHLIMDELLGGRDDCRIGWRSAAHSAERGDGNSGRWQQIIGRSRPGCGADSDRPGYLEARDHHIVEESLANALKLAQRLMPQERAALELLVTQSPPAYRAGLMWQIPEAELLDVMLAWRWHKHELRELRARWGDLLPTAGAPANCLADALLAGTPITNAPNFERDLAHSIAGQLSSMVDAWQRDHARYDNALNGDEGVYEWLCRSADFRSRGLTAADRDRWLAEWASRGPTGARCAAEFRR